MLVNNRGVNGNWDSEIKLGGLSLFSCLWSPWVIFCSSLFVAYLQGETKHSKLPQRWNFHIIWHFLEWIGWRLPCGLLLTWSDTQVLQVSPSAQSLCFWSSLTIRIQIVHKLLLRHPLFQGSTKSSQNSLFGNNSSGSLHWLCFQFVFWKCFWEL